MVQIALWCKDLAMSDLYKVKPTYLAFLAAVLCEATSPEAPYTEGLSHTDNKTHEQPTDNKRTIRHNANTSGTGNGS